MATVNLSPYETRIIVSILRCSYGWHNPDKHVSINTLKKLTGIERRNLSRTKKKMIDKKILLNGDSKIRINPNCDEWASKQTQGKLSSVETQNVSTETHKVSSSGTTHINKGINKTINKETTLSKQTQEAFEYFCNIHKEELEFAYITNFAKDKRLLKELIKVNGLDIVKRSIYQFLISKDEWLTQNTGFTIPMFSSKFNQCANQAQQNKPQTGIIINKGVPR